MDMAFVELLMEDVLYRSLSDRDVVDGTERGSVWSLAGARDGGAAVGVAGSP